MITLAHELTHSFDRIVVSLVGQIRCPIDEHSDKFEVPWWVQYRSSRIRVVKTCVVKLGVKPYSPEDSAQKLFKLSGSKIARVKTYIGDSSSPSQGCRVTRMLLRYETLVTLQPGADAQNHLVAGRIR